MQRLQPGFTLGARYVLRKRVGAGGMGEVWAANDTLLARTVALKIMHPHTDDELVFARRFREEAMHTAGLSHLNIATLFDYGEDDGLAYLVMELVRGVTLQQLLDREGAMPPSRVRSVIGQAALALSVAHSAGIVHRDVKPANIMVTKDGTVKLTDFGIARSADSSGLTRQGEMLGTPHYVSPEQALGHVATPLSDLYSLGIVAHELLSGRRPFDRGTPVATALAHVQDPPPPLPDGVPDDLRDIVERCIAKEPSDRPQSALDVAAALGIPVIEAGWPQAEGLEARRGTGESSPTDTGTGPRRGIVVMASTEPMQLPADWDDPDPTPARAITEPAASSSSTDEAGASETDEGPTTEEIEAGGFPLAAEVRERLDDRAGSDAAAAESLRFWLPSSVAPEEPVSVTSDPWPEAATPTESDVARPMVSVDDVAPAPRAAATPVAFEPGDRLPAGLARGVPIGWVIVLVVVAVVVAVIVDRLI